MPSKTSHSEKRGSQGPISKIGLTWSFVGPIGVMYLMSRSVRHLLKLTVAVPRSAALPLRPPLRSLLYLSTSLRCLSLLPSSPINLYSSLHLPSVCLCVFPVLVRLSSSSPTYPNSHLHATPDDLRLQHQETAHLDGSAEGNLSISLQHFSATSSEAHLNLHL
eukprot:748807-Hanusia_phi.AAC.6